MILSQVNKKPILWSINKKSTIEWNTFSTFKEQRIFSRIFILNKT